MEEQLIPGTVALFIQFVVQSLEPIPGPLIIHIQKKKREREKGKKRKETKIYSISGLTKSHVVINCRANR